MPENQANFDYSPKMEEGKPIDGSHSEAAQAGDYTINIDSEKHEDESPNDDMTDEAEAERLIPDDTPKDEGDDSKAEPTTPQNETAGRVCGFLMVLCVGIAVALLLRLNYQRNAYCKIPVADAATTNATLWIIAPADALKSSPWIATFAILMYAACIFGLCAIADFTSLVTYFFVIAGAGIGLLVGMKSGLGFSGALVLSVPWSTLVGTTLAFLAAFCGKWRIRFEKVE